MSCFVAKTLVSFPLLSSPDQIAHHNGNPISTNRILLHCSSPNPPRTISLESNGNCESRHQFERGLEFDTGETFFRHESATGRDLGVLSAFLYRKSKGNLRVVDAMCGCGIRSLRYLVQAEADFVWANDANDYYRRTILSNLSREARVSGNERRWTVTHFDANRLLTECYLQRDFFDLIDVDSFGSDSSFFRSAFNALKLDGLLYITSTDGYSSGGHRPHHSLAAYGAYVRPLPFSNEVGLRMLIGGASRDASMLGYNVTPIFSYYSYHGPVFRVMLRVSRGKLPESRHYSFISYCIRCGNSQVFSWDKLGQICCPCGNGEVSESLVVSGPLWTGPLHNAADVREMLDLAKQWEWIGNGTNTGLEKLLKQMIDESDPDLPVGYIKLDEVASRAKINSPPLRIMMSALHSMPHLVEKMRIRYNFSNRKGMQPVGHTFPPMRLRQTVPWQCVLRLLGNSSNADGLRLLGHCASMAPDGKAASLLCQ